MTMDAPFEVVGRGMLAHAFSSARESGPPAIICASGVADSQTTDETAFQRERTLLGDLASRARERDAVLVYFSAAPVYGRIAEVRVETATLAPETPYGRHKLCCEALVADSGARHLVLRLPNVVGPAGHPNQLVPSLIAQAVAGSMQIMAGATRDLIDVDDVVRIVAALLRTAPASSTLNVASGRSMPVSRLAETIISVLRLAPTIRSIDGGDRQEFSTARIRGLLPDYPQFDSDYPIRVLARRVPSIERALREGALPS
jgi:nucleoside-diphosphate-sugar epimerase